MGVTSTGARAASYVQLRAQHSRGSVRTATCHLVPSFQKGIGTVSSAMLRSGYVCVAMFSPQVWGTGGRGFKSRRSDKLNQRLDM